MYAIISGGLLIALCEEPLYIQRNATGVFVKTTPEEAIGVAVAGEPYNLPGSTAIEGASEAFVREEEAGEYIFRNRMRIVENEESTRTAFVEVEDAMCEMDTATDERLTAVEDALCELDMERGGEN